MLSSSSSASGGAKRRGRAIKNPNPINTLSRWKSPFPDFGSYMAEKNRKLREQFDSEASTSSRDSGNGKGIFQGVSIFVDGFTIPSSQELKGYMMEHGGRFENYFSRFRVTHIICGNLPDSKMRNLRAFSRGLPVVKPTWVLDSVVANKLLSWVPYQLEDFTNGSSKQQKLSSFFTSSRKDSDHHECSKLQPESRCILSKQESEVLLLEGSNDSEYMGKDAEEFAYTGEEKVWEGEQTDPKSPDKQNEHIVMDLKAFESSPHRSSAMTNSSHIDNNISKEVLKMKSPSVSYQHHSTATDPDFVKNYFKNSRLHFIGTWRNRYRKRFSDMTSGDKCQKISVSSATKKPVIIHIDMDCFFVSVVVRNYPELLDKPVAVCHSDNPKGTAEISSANYPARNYGVKAGMFVRDAKARCPHLVIIPYDFEAYQEVADQFYSILHKHCNQVQALSCDEAFLDVTECCNDDPQEVAQIIRNEIAVTTGCTASAGIAGNLLIARLATKSAKPNGQYFIPSEKVDDYLKDLPIKALPGIGHALNEKLKSIGVQTCGQLRIISKEVLQKNFGMKIGGMLWNYSRGVDGRNVEVIQEMKSVGAEINWGVRFNDGKDCHHFLLALCEEVSLRLQGCGVRGRTVTLKLKKRRKGAEEPIKFMGCGDCESLSRSTTLPVATDSTVVLQRTTKQLFASSYIDLKEIRGVGLQLSRLEHVDSSRQGWEDNALASWLASASEQVREEYKEIVYPVIQKNPVVAVLSEEPRPNSIDDANIPATGSCGSLHGVQCCTRSTNNRPSTLPLLSQLDIGVIKNLPAEIISEMNDVYNGKLFDYIGKHDKEKCETKPSSTVPLHGVSGTNMFSRNEGHGTEHNMIAVRAEPAEMCLASKRESRSPPCSVSTLMGASVECKGVENMACQIETVPFACARNDGLPSCSNTTVFQNDLMPASLSQADFTVLQHLPEDLKNDIFKSVPAHSAVNSSDTIPTNVGSNYSHDIDIPNDTNSKVNLWMGNPPIWIQKFKDSKSLFLNLIAELYCIYGGNGLLSSSLLSLFSFLPLSFDQWDKSLSSFCELLTQYIHLKIESDIEELYICFRHLKRFTTMSKFFTEVYEAVLPFLQMSVNEYYGGDFQLSIS